MEHTRHGYWLEEAGPVEPTAPPTETSTEVPSVEPTAKPTEGPGDGEHGGLILALIELGQSFRRRRGRIHGISARLQNGLQGQPGGKIAVDQ